jgi:hypothetical protein
MKALIIIALLLVTVSCEDYREAHSVCDNSIPEGIVVDFDNISNLDEYVMTIRNSSGISKVIVDDAVRKYINKGDTIVHCEN